MQHVVHILGKVAGKVKVACKEKASTDQNGSPLVNIVIDH